MRIKSKRFIQNRFLRDDVEQGRWKPGTFVFYRLELPFKDAVSQIPNLEDRIQQSESGKHIKIQNLDHPKDDVNFMFLYNAIFIAAPDPTRTITLEDAASFPSERVFIASLWHSFAGFIYLTIEDDPIGSGVKVGAIAGIGVLPKYRGKKIGLILIKQAIEYFRGKGVEKLICEVYQENEPSLRMFQGLGMKIVGHMILDEQNEKMDV